MGLFRSDPGVDGEIASVLLTDGKSALRAIARQQSRFQQLRGVDEPLVLAAADDMNPARTVFVAGQRVFIIAPGTHTPERVAEVAEIDRASLSEPTAVCLNELNLGFWFTFHGVDAARSFAVAINRAILANRPRSIPPLYPHYYLEILTNAGVPATPEYIANLVRRTVAMFGGQAAAICAQSDSPETFVEFLRTFSPKVALDDQSSLVDDMVDWLWSRNPGFHYGINRQLSRWREASKNPVGTFLDGGEVEPWQWEDGPEGAIAMWRLSFDKTKLNSPAPC